MTIRRGRKKKRDDKQEEILEIIAIFEEILLVVSIKLVPLIT